MGVLMTVPYIWMFLICVVSPITTATYCRDVALGMRNGIIPDNKITSSTGTAGDNARLNYTNGPSWCAMGSDTNPYLQIDLGTPHIICAVSTQGNHQGDQWVETFQLSFSQDGKNYSPYKGYVQTELQTFYGNVDGSGIVKQILYKRIVARYLRILPKMYHVWICMRTEIYGERVKSENYAYKKTATQSSLYHGYGKPENAVDGNRNPNYFGWSCTHTHKDYEAWWMVDLGQSIPVHEVYIISRSDITEERLNNFEVHIGNSNTNGGSSNPLCGNLYSIPVGQNKSIYCYPSMMGRYVTIKLQSHAQYLTLCEVEVYTLNLKCAKENIGVSNAIIPDTSLTASSVYGNTRSAAQARLNGSSSWRPRDDDTNPWLQIDLLEIYYVCAVAIQGDPNSEERTTKYEIKWSEDSITWKKVQKQNSDSSVIFSGNKDRSSIARNFFRSPLTVSMLRFYPIEKNLATALRVELYGIALARKRETIITDISSSSPQSITLKWDGIFLNNVHALLKVKLQPENGATQTRTYDSSKGIATVESLQKWTVYKVSLMTFNSCKDGNESLPKFVRTQEDAPSGAPKNFTVQMINSTSVNMTWELPEPGSRNGMIRGFKAYYSKTGHLGQANVLDIKGNTSRNLILNLGGLEYSSAYSFSILAYTVSNGPISTVVMTTKKSKAPSGAPKNFTVQMINSTSVNMTWELPEPGSRNGMIRGFKVYYSKTGHLGQANVLDIKGNTSRNLILNLGGLEHSSAYSFSILAYTVSNGPISTVVMTTKKSKAFSIYSEQHGESSSRSGEVSVAVLSVFIVILIILVILLGWKLWKLQQPLKRNESYSDRSLKGLVKGESKYEPFSNDEPLDPHLT